MASNVTEIAGATKIGFFLRNYTWATALTDMPVLSFGLATDLDKPMWRGASGTPVKLLVDSSGATNFGTGEIPYANSDGEMDNSTAFTYESGTVRARGIYDADGDSGFETGDGADDDAPLLKAGGTTVVSLSSTEISNLVDTSLTDDKYHRVGSDDDGEIGFNSAISAVEISSLGGPMHLYSYDLMRFEADEDFELYSEDGTATGVVVGLYHNSGVPAVNDDTAVLSFFAEDDADAKVEYGSITHTLENVGAATFESSLTFAVGDGGSKTDYLKLDGSESRVAFLVEGYWGNDTYLRFGNSDYGSLGFSSTSGQLEVATTTGYGVKIDSGDAIIVDSASGDIDFQRISDGSAGVSVDYYHDSASPAANDEIAELRFFANNSSSAKVQYGSIAYKLLDTTASAHESSLTLAVAQNGVEVDYLVLNGVDATVKFNPASVEALAVSSTSVDILTDVFNASSSAVDVHDKVRITPEGGIAVKLTNRTGSAVDKGTIVEADSASADDSFIEAATSCDHPIGVVYDSSIADDAEGWIVVSGVADVKYEDNQAATRGYWVGASTSDAGCARTQAASVNGGGDHVGHSIESVAAGGAGTFILGRAVLQFN